MAFAPGLLAAQVLVQMTSCSLVCINMQVNALVTDLQFAGDLFGTPLHAEVERDIGPHLGMHAPRISTALCALRRFEASLFGAIATLPTATAQFAADGAAVPAQQSGDLADGLFSFQEAVNLVSFFLGEVLVHLATGTWRFKRP